MGKACYNGRSFHSPREAANDGAESRKGDRTGRSCREKVVAVEEVASTLGAETTVASRTPPAGEAMPPPKQLGSIRLIRPIGRGGMAEVWLGRHEILRRDVAVKLLSTTVMHEGDSSWKEFIEGASVAAARAHPGLNKVFHADVAEGMPYLVLEYLDGPNLHQLLARSGRLDWRQPGR